MASVILAEYEDEDRITNIINTAIADGEVELLPKYRTRFNGTSVSAPGKKRKEKSKKKEKMGGDSDLDSLAEMIRSKNQRAASGGSNVLSSLFAKYGGDAMVDDSEYNVDDAEFDRIRASLGKNQRAVSGGKKKRKKED